MQSVTCPLCGAVSGHPTDIEQGYCARCHAWTGRSCELGPECFATQSETCHLCGWPASEHPRPAMAA